MKQRVSLSLGEKQAIYLQERARSATDGNQSAYIERLLAEDEMKQAVASAARWYARHPSYAEDAVAETAAALDQTA